MEESACLSAPTCLRNVLLLACARGILLSSRAPAHLAPAGTVVDSAFPSSSLSSLSSSSPFRSPIPLLAAAAAAASPPLCLAASKDPPPPPRLWFPAATSLAPPRMLRGWQRIGPQQHPCIAAGRGRAGLSPFAWERRGCDGRTRGRSVGQKWFPGCSIS